MSKKILAALAAAGFVAAAVAAVTVNPDGTGFVGKGDVQLAFGWNNHSLQANAAGVSFSQEETDAYTATCTWVTGEGTRGEKIHNVDHKKRTEISSAIAYDARKNSQGQITGFNLLGWGSTTTSGVAPVVDGPCPGNPGTAGTWSQVSEPVSSGAIVYVTYNGSSVQISPSL